MKVRFHLCAIDKQCRSYGAPPRLYVHMSGWSLTLALWPSGKTQGFNWIEWRYSQKWHWISLSPPRRRHA